MGNQVVAVLEIGTTQTVALIGEPLEGGRVRVIGKGVAATTGVRKGIITEIKQAAAAVHKALEQAEIASGWDVHEILLAVSGAHIATTPGEGRLPVRAADGKVSSEDVEEIRELARAHKLGADRKVLHALPLFYKLDDLEGITNPEGMRGKQLRLDTLLIHGAQDRIDDAVHLLKDRRVDTRAVIFSGMAASAAVLTPEQKNQGVVLIDLGGGTTNYVVYFRNAVVAVGSLGIGGDHVTNDIAQAFSISISQAEEIKLSEGCAILDSQRSGRRIELPSTSLTINTARSISVKALHTVMEARMRETLNLVREQVGMELRQAGAGVVFTGGGAYMPRLDELAERVFGMRARVGEPLPQYVDGFADERIRPARLATTAGLLIGRAQVREEESALGVIGEWFRKNTKGLVR
jgi:cell division protein FtsA